MGFIFFFWSAVSARKIICLYLATGQKIGQYFFIYKFQHFITLQTKKERKAIVHSAKKGNKKWYTSLIKVH